MYRDNLGRFQRTTGVRALQDVTSLVVQRYLASLQGRGLRPVSVHQHFVCLRAFLTWCVESGLLTDHPMRGITMRLPKTFPNVPEDETVRRLLAACPETWEGKRNRALVALLSDSALRVSEALRLRIEDVRFGERTLCVHAGKGAKDGTGFFGAETAQVLRTWLAARRDA
ncbi:MAG TPA: tyrosine-type recombinase/integrase, partial [bacterium]|nr:tyrosine-type recombinase/integrase [bacterium]